VVDKTAYGSVVKLCIAILWISFWEMIGDHVICLLVMGKSCM